MQSSIVWFRRNLRIRDNAALEAAIAGGRPLVCVYVADEADVGAASRWWLHHSLARLDAALRSLGSSLLIRQGDAATHIAAIATACQADALYFAHRYEPHSRAEEQRVDDALGDTLEINAFDDSLLQHPDSVLSGIGRPYKVFTPYWKASLQLGDPPPPRPAPRRLLAAPGQPESLNLNALGLLPTAPDWSGGLGDTWTPGEDGALQRLDSLQDSVGRYTELRDFPAHDSTSRLSPHLHFGEVSVRQAWHAARDAVARGQSAAGAEALQRQLYWRDFSSYLLHHFPQLPDKPLRPEFEQFPWADDPDALAAWQRGRTGFPLVDAGMRELWHTGWMHNRVRMIVASFLVKDLLIPWQRGAAWFADTLVDADLANNSASWQWVAGCGTDAAPYFRIFNPQRQAEKFDPDRHYQRRWIAELGSDAYPAPIVDHAAARQRALDAYAVTRSAA